MKFFRRLTFFVNRSSIISVLFLIFQQLIVASSTYWIAGLSRDIADGLPFAQSLFLFAGSLVVVFIPAGIAAFFLTWSKWKVVNQYIQSVVAVYYGKTSYRADKRLTRKNTAFLSSEGYLVIDEGHRLIFDWLATILNVSFNIIALGLILDKKLILAYLCSFAFVCLFLKFSHAISYKKSAVLQKSRLDLQQILSRGWENIIIGNTYSFNLWKNNCSNGVSSAQKSSANSEAWNSLSSSIAMTLAMLPVFFTTGVLFYENSADKALLAILVATLPRQIQILQNAHVVVYYATSWSAFKAKLDGLLESLCTTEDQNADARISYEKIRIFIHSNQTSRVPTNMTDAMRMVKSKCTGRLTIRGPNGAGKSTLLNKIKQDLQGSAFLLPAHSELQFSDTYDINLSTGQSLAIQLEEIRRELKASYILLDEWDANLDLEAQNRMNDLIDQISETSVVLEVRHHGV